MLLQCENQLQEQEYKKLQSFSSNFQIIREILNQFNNIRFLWKKEEEKNFNPAIEGKNCPEILTQYTTRRISDFYRIQKFLKIPKTNILLIISGIKDAQGFMVKSLVYYYDLSSQQDNIIYSIQPDYSITQIYYIEYTNKLLIASQSTLIIANVYTLNAEKSIYFGTINNISLIKYTHYAFVTKQTCQSIIIDTNNLNVLATADPCLYGQIKLNQRIRSFILQNGLAFLAVLDSTGFQTWTYNQENTQVVFQGYLPVFYDYQCQYSASGTLYNNGAQIFLLAVCQDFQIISFNIAQETTQLLGKLSSMPDTFVSFEEIKLIAVDDNESGYINLYRFDNITGIFSYFMKFFTNQNKVVNISYLSDKQLLWIQYQFGNTYFPLAQCLNDVNDCLNCQMDFYFKTNEKIQSNNYFGLVSKKVGCGINFNGIQNIMYDNIINIPLNLSLSCDSMIINNSTAVIQNINISNRNYSQLDTLISINNSNQVKLINFLINNCTLNNKFSILSQQSNTNVIINNITISNNTCKFNQSMSSQNSGQLFQASFYEVDQFVVINNTFCNQRIFSTVINFESDDNKHSFSNVIIEQNKFFTISPYLFFNAIYYSDLVPTHQLILSNIYCNQNTYLPNMNDQQKQINMDFDTSYLFQINKIKTLTISNVTMKNHFEIAFSSISYAQQVSMSNISCLNDKNFISSSLSETYAGCMQFFEINYLELNVFNSSYINAIDNSLVTLINQNYFNNTIQLTNIEILNSNFIQTKTSYQVNPIYIQSVYSSLITIQYSKFQENILKGIQTQQAFSTTALNIINQQGETQLLNNTFSNSKSNSIYNFIYISSQVIVFNSSQFLMSSFDLNDSQNQFQQQGGFAKLITNQLQIYNCSFSQSTANKGSFLFIESLSFVIKIVINKCFFQEGFSKSDGSAIFINTPEYGLDLSILNSQFSNIFSQSQDSYVISIKYPSLNNSTYINQIYFDQVQIENIYGNINSAFIDIINSQLVMQDILISQNMNYIIPKQLINQGFSQLQQLQIIQTQNSSLAFDRFRINSLSQLYSSQLSLFINSGNSNISFSNSNFTNLKFSKSLIDITNGVLSSNGGVISIIGLKNSQNSINNCQFKSNKAQLNGGALYLEANQEDEFKLEINSTQFSQNSVQQGYGGALFLISQISNTSKQQILINNSLFQMNEAFVGGALYNQGINPYFLTNVFQNNVATYYGDDQFSYPNQLYLFNYADFNNQYDSMKQKIILNKFKSGGTLPDFIFQLKDNSLKPIISIQGQILQVKVQISNQTQDYTKFQISGDTYQNIDNSGKFIFSGLKFVGIPGSKAFLDFSSDSIKVYNNKTMSYDQNYIYRIEVNFRNCTLGEIINKYNQFQECQACDNGKYTFDFSSCQPCVDGGICEEGLIYLKSGYWREEQYSPNIFECVNRQNNCVGQSFGNEVCIQGHIGPLCEECDIFGNFWKESYTKKQKYECIQCQQFNSYIWKLIITPLLIFLCMQVTVQNNERNQLEKIINNAFYQRSSQKQQMQRKFQEKQKSRIYIKVLINYVQIIANSVTFNQMFGFKNKVIFSFSSKEQKQQDNQDKKYEMFEGIRSEINEQETQNIFQQTQKLQLNSPNNKSQQIQFSSNDFISENDLQIQSSNLLSKKITSSQIQELKKYQLESQENFKFKLNDKQRITLNSLDKSQIFDHNQLNQQMLENQAEVNKLESTQQINDDEKKIQKQQQQQSSSSSSQLQGEFKSESIFLNQLAINKTQIQIELQIQKKPELQVKDEKNILQRKNNQNPFTLNSKINQLKPDNQDETTSDQGIYIQNKTDNDSQN
ncbi:hypothetical protein ABPG73_014765 [Tetrahymena malaccensis]